MSALLNGRTAAARPGQTRLAPAATWDWQDNAACRGKDLALFFGAEGERQPEREAREAKAKKICAQCPTRVFRACLDDAIARNDKHGVRGGMGEDERASERRRRQRRAASAAQRAERSAA